MSVDTRLRQARPDEDSRWEAGLNLALEDVVRNARRRRTRHAAIAAGAVAAVIAVGGLAVGLTNGAGSQPAPAGPPPATPTTSFSSVARTSPLDGEWSTGKLDRQDVVTALVNAGTDPAVAAAFASGLPRGTFRYRMTISRGTLQAYVNRGDPHFLSRSVSVTGDTLTLISGMAGYGHWTYDYNLDRDSLALDLSDTTVPDFGGFTSRVQGVAMFCVAPFIRAS